LKRKNKKRFFPFQSMPNLNFAELILLPSQHDFLTERQQTAHLTESLVYDKSQQIIQHSGGKAREYWGLWGCLWFPGSRLAVNDLF